MLNLHELRSVRNTDKKPYDNKLGDDMALEGLSTMFKNPAGAKVLAYKNYDTTDGKPELSAFFLPAHKFALVSKYLDNRGVTN
jgi:hypothetical protein